MNRLTLRTFCLCVVIINVSPPYCLSAGARKSSFPYSVVPQRNKGKAYRPPSKTIWNGIKIAARNAVRTNPQLITAPRFTLEQVGPTGQLTIVKGEVGDLGFGEDPYGIPFRKQILIEALRHALTAEGPQFLSAGRPYLECAEIFVAKIVADLESEPDKTVLREEIRESEKQIDEFLYDKIYQAIEQLAQRKHYNVIYGRGGNDPKKFSVTITTVPDGAKVYVMTELVYRKQLIKRVNPAYWPWIEVVQNPHPLLGRNRYLTVWPGGRRTEGTIDVTSGSPIRLLPN